MQNLQFNNLFCMYQVSEERILNRQQKASETPQTADSEPEFKYCAKEQSLFDEIQFYRFSGPEISDRKVETEQIPVLQVKQERSVQKQTELLVGNYYKSKNQYPFKIIFQLHGADGKVFKKLVKKIDTIIEEHQEMICIFESQYQNFEIVDDQILLTAFLETQQGFKRCFWKEQIKNLSLKSQELLTINNLQRKIKLNISQEIRKSKIGKPLCIKMPYQIVDDILDEKFELLNKSDRLNKIQSISELQGILYQLSKQNMGSRIIQKLLCKSNDEQLSLIFAELKPHLTELVFDSYGNYVFQRLFQFCASQKRQIIFQAINQDLINIIKSKTGTFTLQGILKIVNYRELYCLLQCLKPHLIDLSMNQYGHHFIKQILGMINDEEINYCLLSNFEILSKNRFGVVVLKSFINFGAYNPILRAEICNSSYFYFNSLSVDEYGHYIIEELFKYYNSDELYLIFNHLQTYVVFYSQNQYSSSIIKKALENFKDIIAISLADTLINEGLDVLMQSNAGGFILHRLMDNLEDQKTKNTLMRKMKSLSPKLNSYEKKTKWKKFFGII